MPPYMCGQGVDSRSCVVGSRSPGWRAAGGGGVDGCGPGVRLVPMLFESFLDSTLGGGELHGCGFFVLFLVVALGALSESGGPGVSVPASLCSGAPPSGPSDLVVLGSLGRVRGMGSRLRGNDDLAGLRVSGSFDGAQDRLGTSGVGCGATAPAAPLGSRPVSSTGQAPGKLGLSWPHAFWRGQALRQAQGERDGFPPRIEYGAGSSRE